MKYLLLLIIGLMTLCSALYFQQTQQTYFNKTEETYQGLKKELKTIEEDLKFLEENHQKLHLLTKKGWDQPQSRLIGAEAIQQGTNSLNAIRFTIGPEVTTIMEEKYPFKVSKIIIEGDALFDNDIYDFTAHLLKNFPGILILRKLSVHRHDPVNEINILALRAHKRPNFVVGEIICEWFSIEGKKHEE